MPTRNVVLSEQQQQLVETLVQSGRCQNPSEVLREGLRLIATRERREHAKLEALQQAARLGWADVSAGRYADVADDQLEDFNRAAACARASAPPIRGETDKTAAPIINLSALRCAAKRGGDTLSARCEPSILRRLACAMGP